MRSTAEQPISGASTLSKNRLAIVYRSPDSVTLDPRNSRKHPEKQIKHLMRGIETFDFLVPALMKLADLDIKVTGFTLD